MIKKALKFKRLRCKVPRLPCQKSFTDKNKARLCKLAAFLDEADKATLALEPFIYDLNAAALTPPDNRNVDILDLLYLRNGNLLNQAIIAAALVTACDETDTVCMANPAVNYNVQMDVAKQLRRAFRAGAEKVIILLNHSIYWVGLFFDKKSNKCFIYNPF